MMQTVLRLQEIATEFLDYIIEDTIEFFAPILNYYGYCYFSCFDLQNHDIAVSGVQTDFELSNLSD